MNMFVQEWKMIRRSTVIWTCSMVAVVAMYLSLFSSIARDAEQFKQLFAAYPEPVRDAIGLSLDQIASLIGFYSFIFGFVVLIAAIQAMNLGVGMLSRETRDKTADFLLTKPVTRSQVVTAKLAAAVVSLVVTNVVYIAVACLLAMSAAESVPWREFVMISVTAFFVQLLFLSLGLVMSVLASKIRSVIAISLATVFSFYIIGMVGSAIGERSVRYVTPFKYFDAGYIAAHAAYEMSFVWVSVGIVVVAVAGSYYIFGNKDIHAV